MLRNQQSMAERMLHHYKLHNYSLFLAFACSQTHKLRRPTRYRWTHLTQLSTQPASVVKLVHEGSREKRSGVCVCVCMPWCAHFRLLSVQSTLEQQESQEQGSRTARRPSACEGLGLTRHLSGYRYNGRQSYVRMAECALQNVHC